jgi:Metallo-beta-lactamase superfamily
VRKLAGSDLKIPPRSDEVEISVFGPGFGECIIVHLTGGEWIVVDSCLNAQTREPAALDYFQRIGVDPATAVRFVVSSHWHDDHIRGIGKVFEKCKSARFVCAHGLRTSQFTKLIGLYSHYFPAGGSGIQEFTKVLSVLTARRKMGSLVAPDFVSEGTMVFQRDPSASVFVKALSPSSAAYLAALARFSEGLVPKEDQSRSGIPNLEPNDLAIVLTVKVEALRFLLGADLEEGGRAGLGWQAVLDKFAHTDNSHEGFKIPHHGSVSGHHEEVWPKLFDQEAWAVLTPCVRGKNLLPEKTDIERICSYCRYPYITAQRSLTRYRYRDSTVQRQLREMGVTIDEEDSKQGHVRFRRSTSDSNSDWTVEMFGDACDLSNLLQPRH